MQDEVQLSHWISRLSELDWDYDGDQSDSKFSSLHFHPGRFISQIPAALIGRLSSPGETILDPFCGSGTSLVEAQRMGRRAIGVDINPVSVLIAEAKTLRLRSARIAAVMESHLKRFHASLLSRSSVGIKAQENVPASVQMEKWYQTSTAAELEFIWLYISSVRGYGEKLLRFCFSAILMPACSENRNWGYVCDNTRPLAHRYVDAFRLFGDSIANLIEAYKSRDRTALTDAYLLPKVKVLTGDSSRVLKGLESNSIDLVVTSPPYYGVIDYAKSQRLAMEWFGLDMAAVRLSETGARSKRSRMTAAAEYINELNVVFVETTRVMKNGAFCCIVFGQSMKRESRLEQLLDVLTQAGLKEVFRTKRAIAGGRRQTPHLLDEYLLIMQKCS